VECESADKGILVIRISDERTDSKNDETWLFFAYVGEIEIDELLLFDIDGVHIL
jgi:hypothetical protein